VLPLIARKRAFGVVAFVLDADSRRYDEGNLAVGKQLARRIALFIDNARLHRAAQRTEVELRKALDARDEFLGMVSHELRTPLTVISGGAHLLRTRGWQIPEETKDELIVDIEEEADHLLGMVQNLLAMARFEFELDIAAEPVLVERIVQRIAAQFRQRRPGRPLNLHFEPGLLASAEPSFLEQIVRNLLSNADKYSPPGSLVEIAAARNDARSVAIRVLDRGIGLEPGEICLIFDRFYRSERASALAGGSGLGLALCKRLVEAMSGQIWARLREGGGLEVGFTLPLYRGHGSEPAGEAPVERPVADGTSPHL